MSKIVTTHSFRGGTGKSNIIANVAVLLTLAGYRVGIIDTDIQSPGIHVVFGLSGRNLGYALNDYLFQECDIAKTVHDVTDKISPTSNGKLYLIPCSVRARDISHVLREGYNVNLLVDGFRDLIQTLALDILLIDTHPGLNEETIFLIAISQILVIVMRPDQQDYEGTGVTVEVARSLEVPQSMLIVNKMPSIFDPAQVQAQVELAYQCEVAAVLPHIEEMMILASSGIFVLKYPQHPLTALYQQIARRLMS